MYGHENQVSNGSPAEGELHRGDVVTQINGHPTSEMTHREGADMIKNAGTTISLVVQRYSFPHTTHCRPSRDDAQMTVAPQCH